MDRLEVYYRITPKNDTVEFDQVDESELYESRGRGFVRKALLGPQRNRNSMSKSRKDKKFTDEFFTVEKSKDYFLARISDLYDFDERNVNLFPETETSSIIEESGHYSSFMCESGLLNYNYLRTLFITQKVNKEGRYQYFVKREGEYIVQECDDIIPVDKKTWKPMWGLSYKYPWQIVLFKAWLKECGGWREMMTAPPFALIDAFGLPQYKLFNFRKQMRFLKQERVPMEQKQQKLKFAPLNNEHIMMIAATADDQRVEDLGLIRNKAGYKVFPIEVDKDNNMKENFYKIETNLPCNWIGKMTPVVKTEENQKYDQHDLNLENTFILTEQELLQCFNKFYAVPEQLSFTNSFTSQDCIQITVDEEEPTWIRFEVEGREESSPGLCGISIQLSTAAKYQGSYPDIRYFLAKRNSAVEVSRSHLRGDVRGSERDGNAYTSSSCDKWDHFGIDYIQGYHHSANCFPKITPGQYYLYVHSNKSGQVRIRFDSQVAIKQRPEKCEIDPREKKEIFDSLFFEIGVDQGVQTSFTKQSFQESINLNSSFEELGFASVCIKTLQNAAHNVAMRIHINKLRQHNIRVLPEYNNLIKDEGNGNNTIVLMSAKGHPEIVVMEKISNRRESSIGAKFPPDGSFEFFKVYPNKPKPLNQK